MKNTAVTSNRGYVKKYLSKAIFIISLYVSKKAVEKCAFLVFYEPEMPECLYKKDSIN